MEPVSIIQRFLQDAGNISCVTLLQERHARELRFRCVAREQQTRDCEHRESSTMTDKANEPVPSPESDRGLTQVSRRALLRGAAIAAGGAAVLVSTIVPAEAKMPQKAAQYQDKPKGQQMCSNCSHFQPPSSCGIVDGKISPNGWCQFYVKK